MRPRIPGLLLGSLCLALTACKSSAEASGRDLVLREARNGRFEEALAVSKRLLDATPGDPRLVALHRDVQVALRLDRARDQVFREELSAALETLQEAAALAPDNEVVRAWIRKTRLQLADVWLDRAAALSGTDRLEEVEAAYETVLEHDPGNSTAVEGLARTLLLMNYRSGQSFTYFKQGLGGFRRLQLEQARRDFQISNEYRENDPARERAAQVEEHLAAERLEQAEQFERDGYWFAARNEYRMALLIDPRNDAARQGLDRMDRETRASTSLGEADMEIRRGELEGAQETLEEVAVLTEAQQDSVTLLQAGIEERGHEQIYERALSLEEDYRYPEAVAVYDELLAVAPTFRDADLRKATLEEWISASEDFYQRALSATSEAEAAQYLRSIQVIWPEYKDAAERLEALERGAAPTEKAPEDDPDDAGAAPEDAEQDPGGGRQA
jgi:tetratricopeptide (TPR) repeat protein